MATTRFKDYLRDAIPRLKKIQRRNLQTLRHRPWPEISGAFGDLGTLVPIFVALAAHGSISVSSTLVFSGLANILTGMIFGIPLPVQPMKAIAAVAIAGEYTKPQLASAGLFVATVIGLLSVTGLIQWFTKRIPLPIVKGIQTGTALQLCISAGGYMPRLSLSRHYPSCLLLAAVLLFLFFCSVFRRVPFALGIVLLALISLATFDDTSSDGQGHRLSLWSPSAFVPSWVDFYFGAINAGLGQLPLTTLNSIIAVTYLAEDLLPDVPTPSATAIGISVSSMNLVGCWFGAMPLCHGSGGLASQYRFGARSGASVIILGMIKLILGLFAAEYAVAYCQKFPAVPLGTMLFLAGIELAKMGESLNTDGARDLWEKNKSETNQTLATKPRSLTAEERLRRWTVMLVTVGALVAFKNDGIGFLAGFALHGSYILLDRIDTWRINRGVGGPIRLEHAELSQEPPVSSEH